MMRDIEHGRPERDFTVELWRFFFCIAVLGLHFFPELSIQIFRAGYLGVEFFFLLSGYGIYVYYERHICGRKCREKWIQLAGYIKNRLQRLYPLYLLSLLAMLLLRIIMQTADAAEPAQGWHISDVIAYLKSGWAEFFMLQCSGLGGEVLISSHWYVAALFWGSIVLLLVLLLTDWFGALLLCPLFSFSIYFYFFKMIRKIDVIFSYYALLRAVAGLALGIFLGATLRLVQKRCAGVGHKHKGIIYLIANLILTAVLVYMNFGHRCALDFVVIALFAVSLWLLLFAQYPLNQKKKALFQRLSSVTYPVYLFQMPCIELLLWLKGILW